jgi:selenide,water dikinase
MTTDDDSPRLTEYASLHGCSCKIGQGDLESLLADVGLDDSGEQRREQKQGQLLFGVGEDASAQAITDDLALVTTIDYFTPVIDDPYDFGRIAACNATSDAFAKGGIDNVNALVVLGLPREVRDTAGNILRGLVDAIEEMDGVVSGGHTILNPWPLAGAAVTATGSQEDLLTTRSARPGDHLYLTKPLGTQPAMGALRVRDGEFSETVREATPRPIDAIGTEALAWMTTPNRAAAEAALDTGATAATDITGFGLTGQSRTLATNAGVGIELTNLPVIAGTPPLSRLFGYGLEDGESAETSGGLLLSVPDSRTTDLEAAFEDRAVFYRRVGRVTNGTGVTLTDPTIEPIRR